MTGRGHLDVIAIERTKELLRKRHPEPVRIIDVALYTQKSQARAARLLDYLSGSSEGYENSNYDFLIYVNDERPRTYSIFKDTETGIYP
jgi:hypothetical protein